MVRRIIPCSPSKWYQPPPPDPGDIHGRHALLGLGRNLPDYMDACEANASEPVEIAGRNRISRYAGIQCVEADPVWKGGEYTEPPAVGLRGAYTSLFWMTSSPWQLQRRAPTREQAEKAYNMAADNFIKTQDANDMIYAFDASRNYNPNPTWLR